MESKLVVFKDNKIRRILLENEWYFVFVDVVAALTDSNKPRDYWYRLTKRELDSSGVQLSIHCRQLNAEPSDEKESMSEISNTKELLRINNKVPCHV